MDINERLCLIEDIMKAKKLLFGLGKTEHNEFLSNESAGELFNELYDLPADSLRVTMGYYEKIINKIIKEGVVA